MVITKDLTGYYYGKIVKSLNYLEYTFNRVKNLPLDPRHMSNEQMEIWDSFATRFARASDLFLSKYIKAVVQKDDPAFDGSFRDFLNLAEKMGVIDSVDTWLDIRELRNVVVHEYSDEDLKRLLEKMIKYAPLILELRRKLANAP